MPVPGSPFLISMSPPNWLAMFALDLPFRRLSSELAAVLD